MPLEPKKPQEEVSLSHVEKQELLTKARGMLGIQSERELEELRSSIRRSKGIVFVLVHPFFEKVGYAEKVFDWLKLSSAEGREDRKSILRMQTRLKNYLSAVSDRKPPLIVFEERQKVSATRNILGAPGAHFVSTGASTSRPSFEHESPTGPVTGTWNTVRDVFQKLGVQQILLGGMYLFENYRFPPNYPRSAGGGYGGCVGTAREELEVTFKVDIASIAHPISRRDFTAIKRGS